MKKTTIFIGLMICLLSTSFSYSQETKYVYGVVDGKAKIYGKNVYYYYFTKIDEANCFVFRSQAQNQLSKEFRSITSKWDEYQTKIYIFNSYDDAINARNKYITDTKRARSTYFDARIPSTNVVFDYKCDN